MFLPVACEGERFLNGYDWERAKPGFNLIAFPMKRSFPARMGNNLHRLGAAILCHSQLRAVINLLKLNVVHERLNQLQSPATPAVFLFGFGVELLTVLACHTCRHHTATR